MSSQRVLARDLTPAHEQRFVASEQIGTDRRFLVGIDREFPGVVTLTLRMNETTESIDVPADAEIVIYS